MVTIQLQNDAALVLFELLSRHDSLDHHRLLTELRFEDPAERNTLWELHGVLEKELVEPFDERYKSLVDAARTAVRTRGQAAE